MKSMKKYVIFALVLLMLPLGKLPARAESDTLESVIQESCITGKEADVSSYSITKEDMEKLFLEMLLTGKLPWYTDRNFSCIMDGQSRILDTFTPKLLSSQTYDRDSYARAKAEILHECIQEGMEPLQKALAVHDYLVSHFSYDSTLQYSTSYDLMVKGRAVCNGYAQAYMELMLELGIPCRMVESSTMGDGVGHTWNMIQLEDSWYHVDCTWDDPMPNIEGQAFHDFFLLTDEEMKNHPKKPHFDWYSPYSSQDTAYQDGFWRKTDSPILFPEPQTCLYRIRDSFTLTLLSRSCSTGEEHTLHQEPPAYIDIGGRKAAYPHNGLAMADGRIYLSTVDQLISMAPDGSDQKTEYTYDLNGNKKFIMGFCIRDGQIPITLSDQFFNFTSETASLADGSSLHTHSYTSQVHAPDCTKAGFTLYTCSCGAAYQGSQTPALGHSYQAQTVKAPGLSSEGLQKEVCSRCGDSRDTVIPALGLGGYLKENLWIPAAGAGILLVLIPVLLLKKKKS